MADEVLEDLGYFVREVDLGEFGDQLEEGAVGGGGSAFGLFEPLT